MFHIKQLNNPIKSLQEKVLSVTYEDGNSSFNKLLNLDKSVSTCYRNIKYLLAGIYRVKMGLSTPIMSDIFSLSKNSSYNLRSGVNVNRRNI